MIKKVIGRIYFILIILASVAVYLSPIFIAVKTDNYLWLLALLASEVPAFLFFALFTLIGAIIFASEDFSPID
jgi:hypothetical protein